MEAAALPVHPTLRRPVGSRLLRLRSDEQLVARFRAGDEAAFEVIHDRYRPRLLAYVRQMLGSSRSDAEDALQDVLMRAHTTLRADDRPVALRAWLYRVAHNRCIDQLRRPAHAQAPVELPDTLSSREDPVRDAEAREELERLVADIGRLPEQQRSALLMREMEGLGHVELAAALDVTVPAVKSLLVRARVGLTEARLARDTDCREIQEDLADSHDRGVRASAKAKRHLRECACCVEYRAALRGVDRGLAALSPGGGPWALVLKGLGLGGAGSAGLLGGGGTAAVTTTTTVSAGAAVGGSIGAVKVAALVSAAVAVVGGGAVEGAHRHEHAGSRAHAAHAAPAAHVQATPTAGVPAAALARIVAPRAGTTPHAVAAGVAGERAAAHRRHVAAARRRAAQAAAARAAVTGAPVVAAAPGALAAPATDPSTPDASTPPAETESAASTAAAAAGGVLAPADAATATSTTTAPAATTSAAAPAAPAPASTTPVAAASAATQAVVGSVAAAVGEDLARR